MCIIKTLRSKVLTDLTDIRLSGGSVSAKAGEAVPAKQVEIHEG